jgi:hypothetical protein
MECFYELLNVPGQEEQLDSMPISSNVKSSCFTPYAILLIDCIKKGGLTQLLRRCAALTRIRLMQYILALLGFPFPLRDDLITTYVYKT